MKMIFWIVLLIIIVVPWSKIIRRKPSETSSAPDRAAGSAPEQDNDE